MMTRDQYAAAVAGDTAKSAAYVRDHSPGSHGR